MSRIGLNGNIGSLLSFYKHERNIFGRCPHCDVPFRLSEVKLTYGKQPPRDELTQMKRIRDRLEKQLESVNAEIDEQEEEHAQELEQRDLRHADAIDLLTDKWSDRFDNEVDKRVRKREKDIARKAIAKSRAGQLGKTLEKIGALFPGFGHHPYDVRPVFDPIDFVVFDGYYSGEVREVTFVEFKTGQSRLKPVQESIKEAIRKKRVSFEVRRISRETINMLASGRPPKAHEMIEQIAE